MMYFLSAHLLHLPLHLFVPCLHSQPQVGHAEFQLGVDGVHLHQLALQLAGETWLILLCSQYRYISRCWPCIVMCIVSPNSCHTHPYIISSTKDKDIENNIGKYLHSGKKNERIHFSIGC